MVKVLVFLSFIKLGKFAKFGLNNALVVVLLGS